LGCDS